MRHLFQGCSEQSGVGCCFCVEACCCFRHAEPFLTLLDHSLCLFCTNFLVSFLFYFLLPLMNLADSKIKFKLDFVVFLFRGIVDFELKHLTERSCVTICWFLMHLTVGAMRSQSVLLLLIASSTVPSTLLAHSRFLKYLCWFNRGIDLALKYIFIFSNTVRKFVRILSGDNAFRSVGLFWFCRLILYICMYMYI